MTRIRRITALVLLGVTFVVCVFACASIEWPTSAQADEQTPQEMQKKSFTQTWIKAGNKLYRWDYNQRNNSTTAGIQDGYLMICKKPYTATERARNIKNSNPNVLSFTYKQSRADLDPDEEEYYGTIIYALKAFGKTMVTYTEYTQAYTNEPIPYEVTANICYVKYTNPLKTFKVGSKSYLKGFKKQPYSRVKSKKLKGKLKVKAKKGWKIVQIRRINNNIESDEIVEQMAGGKKKWKLKNGAKLSINNTNKKIENDKGINIQVTCYNKSNKYYTSLILFPGTRLFDPVFG